MIRPGVESSAKALVPTLINLLEPESVIDVGCGEGWWAYEFFQHGCRVIGVDNGAIPTSPLNEKFRAVDLTKPFPDLGKWDLAVCLEVAEHLPVIRAEGFIRDLCNLAPDIIFSAAIPGQGGVGHCFPAGTVVSGPVARGHFSRWYEGPVIELSFSSGQLLTATPNHPILTPKGWVAAGLLQEGSDVIRCIDSERITSMVPDKYQIPSLIEDVPGTNPILFDTPSCAVPSTTQDFHGDGMGGEVTVIRPYRYLRDRIDAAFTQPRREKALTQAGVRSTLLPGNRAAVERFFTPSVALDSGNQGVGDILSRLGRATRGREAVRVSSPTRLDPDAEQPSPHQGSPYAELIRQSLNRQSALVELDQVSSIRSRNLSGHVYNLSTATGWYLANGVIVHNCNEQWPDYWVKLFELNGYAVTGMLRWLIWDDDRIENWYRQNLLLATSHPDHHYDMFGHPSAEPFRVVHPVLYDARRGR